MTAPRERAARELERQGLLLHADPRLPSVTTIVAGEPVRGSWWGHPKGHAIYAVLEALEDAGDATSVKLVNGKLTLVHRSLWPALVAVATCGEDWQTRGLSPDARALLSAVNERGALRADELRAGRAFGKEALGELEARLLVHSASVHTESGKHEKELSTWARWAQPRAVDPPPPVAEAKRCFESIVETWRDVAGATAALAWAR